MPLRALIDSDSIRNQFSLALMTMVLMPLRALIDSDGSEYGTTEALYDVS